MAFNLFVTIILLHIYIFTRFPCHPSTLWFACLLASIAIKIPAILCSNGFSKGVRFMFLTIIKKIRLLILHINDNLFNIFDIQTSKDGFFRNFPVEKNK